MLCDHCGDVYELWTDVRVLNQLANLLGGRWTVWVCMGEVQVWVLGNLTSAEKRVWDPSGAQRGDNHTADRHVS